MPYFETMRRLIDWADYGFSARSYISEYMVFDCTLMRDLVRELAGGKQDVDWYMRTLAAVSDDVLSGSGFSEFETYGNYAAFREPGRYCDLALKTERFGYSRFHGRIPSESCVERKCRDLDTISFESWQLGGA